MKIVFISDLHLCPKTKQHNQLFLTKLREWQDQLDALYILGDFFDYWLGDDDHNHFIHKIKQALKAFATHKPIYFIGGNHDFGIGKRFASETGITLISDLSVIKVGDNNILLSHGDAFCTLDIKYQKMKKILRNPFLMFVLLRMPLSWRYKLKEMLENKSAKSFDQEPSNTYLVVDATIATIAIEKHANVVIHGHTHKPGKYLINTYNNNIITRYEIPDWTDRVPGGYILLDNHTIEVITPKFIS